MEKIDIGKNEENVNIDWKNDKLEVVWKGNAVNALFTDFFEHMTLKEEYAETIKT